MQQIFYNLIDPSWWFTGIFFAVIGFLLSKLPQKLSLLKTSISSKVLRWKEKRILSAVKQYRQNEIKLQWLICRYWCLVTINIIYIGFIVILFCLTPESSNYSSNLFNYLQRFQNILPLVFIMYAFLLYTNEEKIIVDRTIEAHIKWKKRITQKCT